MQNSESSRRIHVLREAEVRKIAAGEVIDRPLSVIRELLDNAIDAGADEITVQVDGGGIERIRVVDNGSGMGAGDLETCILPHATSKITRTEDIYAVHSLGFRGEALSSIAACSKLEITSTSAETPDSGMRISVHAGKVIDVSPAPAARGTTVAVADLFYSLPGRRRFLKRVSSESAACRQAFIEKALPFPGITFRYFADGDLKMFLPAQSFTERAAAVFPDTLTADLLDSGEASAEGFSLRTVITKPGFSRRDRRLLYVFVNGRRISEYALVQAIVYGYSEHLPGGSFPAACLFIDVDPKLVDFNIHPAKREVRFKNLQTIHRATVDLVRSILSGYKIRSGVTLPGAYGGELPIREPDRRFSPPASRPPFPSSPRTDPAYRPIDIENIRKSFGGGAGRIEPPPPVTSEVKYHGQIFGLFLLAEYADRLFVIDQHAAHERIIYERLVGEKPKVQNLLVPIDLDLDEEEEPAVEGDLESYKKLGITIEKVRSGLWQITACPAVCLEMKNELAEFVRGRKGDRTSLEQAFYATVSCRSAVMDGELLDDLSGRELAVQALELDNARCPHGRPIWFEISRERLFELVERT